MSTEEVSLPTCPVTDPHWPCHWTIAPCGRCSNHCDCYREATT